MTLMPINLLKPPSCRTSPTNLIYAAINHHNGRVEMFTALF